MADPNRLAAMRTAARAAASDYDRVNELQTYLHVIEGALRS